MSISGAPATGTLVQGNRIGVGSGGVIAPDNDFGVYIGEGAADNTIGGPAAAAGNVIVSPAYSVYLTSGASGNRVQGNRIGTDPDGMLALGGPGSYGVVIANSNDNTIGGGGAAGNLIQGGWIGAYVVGPAATGNVLEGNLIGTDASGTQAIRGPGSGGLAAPGSGFLSDALAGASLAEPGSPTRRTSGGGPSPRCRAIAPAGAASGRSCFARVGCMRPREVVEDLKQHPGIRLRAWGGTEKRVDACQSLCRPAAPETMKTRGIPVGQVSTCRPGEAPRTAG